MLERVGALVAAVALVSGCGPVDFGPPDCRSTCGMALYANPGAVDCAGFQTAEDLALREFDARVAGFGYDASCRGLAGWRVHQYPGELEGFTAYRDRHGRLIAGQTFCGSGAMVVNTQDWFNGSSLIHEMAHAIERCADPEHETWGVRGIYDAITAARSAGQLLPKPEPYQHQHGVTP